MIADMQKKVYVYDTPIENLHLSQRSYNVLMNANINTVGKLAAFVKSDRDGLLSLKNLGKKLEEEILKLLDSIEIIGVEETAHDQLISNTGFTQQGCNTYTGGTASKKHTNCLYQKDSQKIVCTYNTPISEFNLSCRSYNVLKNNNIDTIGKLADFVNSNNNEVLTPRKLIARSDAMNLTSQYPQLMNLKNLGVKSAQEILNLLQGIQIVDAIEDAYDALIDDCGFSQRAIRIIKSRDIKTISELKKYTFEEIQKWENIDNYTLTEISYALYSSGEPITTEPGTNGFIFYYVINKSMLQSMDKKSIAEYGFSNRAKNIFKEKQIKTLADLRQYSIEEITRWRNVGQKTIDEIIYILSRSPDIPLEQETISKDKINICVCISEDVFHFYTISCLFFYRLLSMHIENSASLDKFLEEEVKFEFCESSSINVILFHKEFSNTNLSKFCESIAQELNSFSGTKGKSSGHILIVAIQCILLKRIELEGIIYGLDSTFCELVCKDEIYLESVKRKLLKLLRNTIYPIPMDDFYLSFPLVIQNSGLIYTALSELEKAGVVRNLGDDSFEIILPSVVDYIDGVKDEKAKDILKRKIINGQTLEEIASEYNITRERVRQIIIQKSNIQSEHISFLEDKYAFVYQKYNFKKKDAKLIFGNVAANYFFLRYESGTIDLEESLDDKSIPQDMRKRIQNEIVYTDYVFVGNQYVKRFRPALYDYYIKHYCTEDIEVDTFIKEYSAFWERHGVEKEIYEMGNRVMQNSISKKKNVLYKYPRTFRFYDFDQYDFTDLLDTLNLSHYENVMLSTAKFTKEYPKLMKQYDIRDEYELHSLLRTLLEGKENGITFHRMPVIEFGKADVNTQVLDLLNENAPISPEKLSLLYEEKYGAQAMTVRASYFNCINKYLHNGLYTMDLPSLTDDEFEYLKRQLTDDFYTISEVKKIFTQKYESVSHINSATLKQLGFIVNENYIIEARFKSAVSYFKYLLMKDGKTAIEDIPVEIRHITMFNTVLNSLLDAYEIVEYDKKKYLNFSKLSDIGITREDIHDFCKEIYSLDLPEYFGMKQIKETGFKHKLFELGFDDWFYERILSRNATLFSSQHIGGRMILTKGYKTVTWVSLLEYILPEEGMDVQRLLLKLKQDFGMTIDKYGVLAKITDSNLYYDRIMEKLYPCYADYFAEV